MNGLEYEVTVIRLDASQDRRTYVFRGLDSFPVGTITVSRPTSVAYPSKPDDQLLVRVDRIEGRRIYATENLPAPDSNSPSTNEPRRPKTGRASAPAISTESLAQRGS